jgi:hypothetical protein
MEVDGAGTKVPPGLCSAASTAGAASAHAAANAIAPRASGPTHAKEPLIEKPYDGNKIASSNA